MKKNYNLGGKFMSTEYEQVVTYYDGSAVSGLVAKREHKTHIRYTSSSTSSKKDELTYNVIKY